LATGLGEAENPFLGLRMKLGLYFDEMKIYGSLGGKKFSSFWIFKAFL